MQSFEQWIEEFRSEGSQTRTVLERVPADKLTWKPHEKSMSLGQLAMHIAAIPAGISDLLGESAKEIPNVPLPEPSSREEILAALDSSLALAEERLIAWGAEGLSEGWTLQHEGTTVLETSRIEMIRDLMLNHSIHHRGQLTVYLRMLEVSLPALYGPSADEG